jgi:hypothetical protein
MSQERDDPVVQAFRQHLEKKLAECNDFINDCAHVARVRPDVATGVAPDEIVDVYLMRQWAIKALAALDTGEEIPPPPDA